MNSTLYRCRKAVTVGEARKILVWKLLSLLSTPIRDHQFVSWTANEVIARIDLNFDLLQPSAENE